MSKLKSTQIAGIATLCYLIDHKKNQILLGKKKYGGAKGKLNGFGGKVETTDKTISDAVAREFKEETTILLKDHSLTSILTIENETGSVNIYIYTATEWEGREQESEEMTSMWVDLSKIPFDQMWKNDKLWFNAVISGEKSLIRISEEKGVLKELNIKFTSELDETAI